MRHQIFNATAVHTSASYLMHLQLFQGGNIFIWGFFIRIYLQKDFAGGYKKFFIKWLVERDIWKLFFSSPLDWAFP